MAVHRLGQLVLLGLWLVPAAHAVDWQESPQVAALFEDAGVTGTFVLHDVGAGSFIGHDRARAERRFSPASTFKVANSLIGLTVGAVSGVDDPLPYTGPPEPFIKAWARDMGLREAIALSNVPIYQALARRIGKKRGSGKAAIELITEQRPELGARLNLSPSNVSRYMTWASVPQEWGAPLGVALGNAAGRALREHDEATVRAAAEAVVCGELTPPAFKGM